MARTKGYVMSEEHKAAIKAARSRKNKTAITLNNKYRIYANDAHNWSLQKHSGVNEAGEDIWLSQIFYHNLNDLLKAVAKRMVNKELKIQGDVSLQELATKIEVAETKVLARLQTVVDDTDDDSDEEFAGIDDEEAVA